MDKKAMYKRCRDILGSYRGQIEILNKYQKGKLPFNQYYKDIIGKYKNVLDIINDYDANSKDAYKCCWDWLSGNISGYNPKVDLQIQNSYIIEPKRKNDTRVYFYTEKLKDFFAKSTPQEDITNPKLLAKYCYCSADGIECYLFIKKEVAGTWTAAQKKLITNVLGKTTGGEDTSFGLILSNDYLGDPLSTLTEERDDTGKQLTIQELIVYNLEKFKKKIIDFENKL